MRRLLSPRFSLPFAVLIGTLSLFIASPRFVEGLQFSVFDDYQRRQPRAYEPVPIGIVDIDDESLERIGQWPWPRTRVAELVTKLTELGAAVIAFDAVFAEPDRTSPQRADWLRGSSAELASLRELAASLPDHDALLARAFAQSRVVAGFSLTNGAKTRSPLAKAGYSWGGPDPTEMLRPFDSAVLNLPELEEAAAGNGSFAFPEAEYAVHRSVPLVFRFGDQLYPSLVAEAIRVAYGASTYMVKSVGASAESGYGEQTGILAVKIASLTIPTDRRGQVWVHYTKPRSERYIPAWEILSGEVDPARIEGQILFVGTSAAGLKDQRPTPVSPSLPGVEVHAQLAEQILLEHWLARPDWARGAEFLFVLVLGAVVLVLLPRVGAVGSALVATLSISLAVGFSWYAYTEMLLLFDPVFPALAVGSVYLSGSFMNYLYSELQRRQIRHAFSHYLSPEIVNELAKNPDALRLGGERRELTLLFCDIRGFTTISEQFDNPEELTGLINRFLTPMTDLIMERRGTIDKYMGDCIMAFWSAPIEDPDHAQHAAEAALAMHERLVKLNDELRSEAAAEGRRFIPLRVGIGLNSGDCCVGNMGSDQRFDYSVIGDEVNLASRLEGQSKYYGVDTVIGDKTAHRLEGFATVELDQIRVKGKLEAVTIHALLGNPHLAERDDFRAYRAAHMRLLAAYRGQDWDAALEALAECKATGFVPGLYALYGERVRVYLEDPPESGWDGVYTATSK